MRRNTFSALVVAALALVAVVASAGEFAAPECANGTCQVRQRSVTRTRSSVVAPVQAVVEPVTAVVVGTARVAANVVTAPVRAVQRSVTRSEVCVPSQADPCCQPCNDGCGAAAVESQSVTRTRTRVRGFRSRACACGCN